MNLPNASQEQIRLMQENAEKKMKQDGIVVEQVEVQPVSQKHPMLTNHEEPTMEVQSQAQESPELDGNEDVEEEVIQDVITETPQQMNFRRMREELDMAKRERDEARHYAMQMNQPKQQAPQPEPEDDYSDIGLDDDGLAEGKHLKKVLKEMREMKKELHSYKQKSYEDTTQIKLTTQYPDYNKVMTTENLAMLENANPELAEMIMNTKDPFKSRKLAYDMVKQYGIYKDSPVKAQNFDSEKAIAQKNAAKPRPLASVSPQQGDSPLSKANAFANGNLSKDMKEQFRREMTEAMRGR